MSLVIGIIIGYKNYRLLTETLFSSGGEYGMGASNIIFIEKILLTPAPHSPPELKIASMRNLYFL